MSPLICNLHTSLKSSNDLMNHVSSCKKSTVHPHLSFRYTIHVQHYISIMTHIIILCFLVSSLGFSFSVEAKKRRRRSKKRKKSTFSKQNKSSKKKSKKGFFTLKVEGDFQSLFYHGNQEEHKQTNTRESLTRLDYHVEPIIITGVKADLKFNLWGLDEVIGSNFEYHGDWLASSGGSISDEGSAIDTISGGNENLTRILKLAVSTYGLETRYKNAHFDFGSYDVVSNITNQKLARGSFELDFVQADIFYNFAWKLRNDPKRSEKEREKYRNWKRLEVGMRYMEYSVPRIIKPSTDEGGLVIGPIQMITQQAYMFGGEMSFVDRNPKTVFGFGVGMGLYYGGGPVAYLDKRGKQKEDFMYMADVPLEVTVRINPLPSGSKFLLNIDLSYYVQYLTYSISDATNNSSSQDTFDGSDFFHGPRAKLVFSY
jgi:hypothetical protein